MQESLEIKSRNLSVIIDVREPYEIEKWLRLFDINVERKVLDLGDYIISDRTVVERKTREDFESSIVDGRLFNQAKRISQVFENRIMIIEGVSKESRISRKALLGAYSSLMVDFGISLMFTKNQKATAEMISALVKHEQILKKRGLKLYFGKKPKDAKMIQRRMIESIPGIGPELADKILITFKNISNLSQASRKDLLKIEGIGEKKADMIWKAFHMSYKND